jgi:hypothetical protein
VEPQNIGARAVIVISRHGVGLPMFCIKLSLTEDK